MAYKSYIRVKDENGEYVKIYPITKAENIDLSNGENLEKKINDIVDEIDRKIDNISIGSANGVASLDANGHVPLSQLPKESKEVKVVENIDQLYDITEVFEGLSVFVKDATGDVSVKSGGAFYIYDGRQFIKTAQADTMNVIMDFVDVENKPTTLEGYGILDAVHRSELVTIANVSNAGKILVLNKNGELDVNITGRANSTAKLDTARKITLDGDVIGECEFDGGSNVIINAELMSRGIRPGEYTKVQVDDKGRIIGVGKATSGDIGNMDWSYIQGTPTTLKDYGITDEVMVRNQDQLMTAYLSLRQDPISDLHAVNKKYVDSMVQGLKTKGSVVTAATENIELYGLFEVGGVEVKENDRVLIFNQSNKTENGLYLAKSAEWVRSEDADEGSEFSPGMSVAVESGDYGGCTFVLINEGSVTIGTDEIEFTQFSSASDVLAGSGLVRDGNVISLETLGSPGQYLKVTVDKHGRVTYGSTKITESDINGSIGWSKIYDKPDSTVELIDAAVDAKHTHVNLTVIDKLSEDSEGNLLYDGKEIATGSGTIDGGSSLDGVITTVSEETPTDLATGGIWFRIIEAEE